MMKSEQNPDVSFYKDKDDLMTVNNTLIIVNVHLCGIVNNTNRIVFTHSFVVNYCLITNRYIGAK